MVLRAIAVGLASLAALGVVGCARTTPVLAPSVVYVGEVNAGGISESFESSEPGGAWRAKDKVDVEWKGQWWPAVVLERRGGRWLVHYEGYGDDWDEVVGVDRIRERHAELDQDGDAPEEPDVDP